MGKPSKPSPSPSPPPKPRHKTGGSLVWKLTAHQVFTLVRIMAFTNAAIIVLLSIALWNRCESAAYQAYLGGEEYGSYDHEAWYTDVLPSGSLSLSFENKINSKLEHQLEKRTERYVPGSSRRLSYGDQGENWYENLDYLEYTISYPAGDGYLLVRFRLFDWVRGFKAFFHPFLVFQCILLFFAAVGTRRSVKKALRPIQQLTLTAQSMTTGATASRRVPLVPPSSVVPPPGAAGWQGAVPPGADGLAAPKIKGGRRQPLREAKPQKLHLSGAIDTLNTINEDHLDMRISIADEREELRGLASAINNMLERLNAAYQSQLRFVSDASHELRTPISVIQGYANLLDRWGKTDEKTLQESIDAIKAEATGMQDLVEQLLFLARSDNNSIAMNLEVVDLSALAQEVLRDAQVIDQSHLLSAKVEEGVFVLGDGSLLKQALRILMDNAIKYTPAGERISISVQDRDERVEVAVTDNGIGIPANDLDQIFERFFRADESRARQSGGTGLGLSIAKWIIDRHGGHVEVTSRQDVGTRFSYLLPKPDKQALEGDDETVA